MIQIKPPLARQDPADNCVLVHLIKYSSVHLSDVFPELLVCSLHIIQQFVVLLSPPFFCVKG